MSETKTLDVAIATCMHLGREPDPDQDLLADALRDAGVKAQWLAWDDPKARFSSAKMTILRSTWNYTKAHEAFLAWVDETAQVSRLHNPASIVRWNVDKKYLLDLAARGIPIIPTRVFSKGADVSIAHVARELGASEVVVKPSISAASARTIHADATSDRARDHLRMLLKTGSAMVQPYVRSVEGYGERAIICIEGEPSHSIRKSPRFENDAQDTSAAMPIADDEAALAKKVLASLPERLLYARIDMVRDANENPVVMEAELTEPSLFLCESRDTLERFVRAIRKRLESACFSADFHDVLRG
jgi:glutathione synthase/RimK-type ligase-like ATP-grasp enzyme